MTEGMNRLWIGCFRKPSKGSKKDDTWLRGQMVFCDISFLWWGTYRKNLLTNAQKYPIRKGVLVPQCLSNLTVKELYKGNVLTNAIPRPRGLWGPFQSSIRLVFDMNRHANRPYPVFVPPISHEMQPINVEFFSYMNGAVLWLLI